MKYHKNKIWTGVLLVQIFCFYLCSKIEFLKHYFFKFFEFQKIFHQKLFSGFPFSIGDFLYLFLGIGLLYLSVKIIIKKSRNLYITKLLVTINVLYFIYQLLWGMLYFQPTLLEKLPKEPVTEAEIKKLAEKYLEKCVASRALVHENEEGVFTVKDLQAIQTEILKNQNSLPHNFSTKKGFTTNCSKPSLFNKTMSYSGILGYYNPFTAEAQYNPNLPDSYLPFTLAHEFSHQLGFAREQEANFIGYLSGKDSENLDLKYSTEYFVLKSLLNSLVEKNPLFVKQVLKKYSGGMKRDRLFEKKFVRDHQGILDIFFGFTNDLFLKSNQQKGTVTYSYFVELMVKYERILQ